MNWQNIWLTIFGTTTWLNIDMGFWVSMGISLIITIIMNVVFWSLKPKTSKTTKNN